MFGSTKKLDERLSSLESTLARLERGFQSLELEWVNAYGKFRKIAARINHDQAVIDSRQEATQPENAGGEENPPGSHTGVLSTRQKAIQQQILRRRAGTA